jgi:hypothetical protein
VSEKVDWGEEYADDDEDCLEPIGEWGGFEYFGNWTDGIFKERGSNFWKQGDDLWLSMK